MTEQQFRATFCLDELQNLKNVKSQTRYEQVLAATGVDREWNRVFLGIGKSEWKIANGVKVSGVRVMVERCRNLDNIVVY
jgi:hypothetical protein